MSEINNNYVKNILYEISKSIILPKYLNLKNEDIRLKNKNDVVTSVDIAVENELKKILLNLIPNSLFVGEEEYYKNPEIIKHYNEAQFCWTVDPIDGTRNFVKGKDKFAIMIGLTFKEKIIQSWIYKPLTTELFCAKEGEGAYLDDKKIIITKKTDLLNSVGSISSKYWDGDYYLKLGKIKNSFNDVFSYGCIGFEYVDIANQVRDFAILSKLSPWDHIPGILLIKEAGGSILHFDKTEYNHAVQKNNLVVSNSIKLQNKIINLIGR